MTIMGKVIFPLICILNKSHALLQSVRNMPHWTWTYFNLRSLYRRNLATMPKQMPGTKKRLRRRDPRRNVCVLF